MAGAYDAEVLDRLRWFRDSFGPLLDMAIRALGGIDLRELMAEALMRGDELHNRNRAATSLFINQIALGLTPRLCSPGIQTACFAFPKW